MTWPDTVRPWPLTSNFLEDYLLAEAERKKREKQEAIEREKAEDLKAEQKFIRQQEQLRQEAEQEKFRKIEEDRVRTYPNSITKPIQLFRRKWRSAKNNSELINSRQHQRVDGLYLEYLI